MFAYVHLKGPKAVAASLSSTEEGTQILHELRGLFAHGAASGVQDVLTNAPTLDGTDRALVERAVIDLFQEVLSVA